MNRRREFSFPEIVLDKTSRTSLHLQIHHQIAAAIHAGRLCPEALLPSTRSLAKLLCVSRNTVMAAYDELVADALIRGERGAGMRVNGAVPVAMSGLERVMLDAHYPARIAFIHDLDGNPLYVNF